MEDKLDWPPQIKLVKKLIEQYAMPCKDLSGSYSLAFTLDCAIAINMKIEELIHQSNKELIERLLSKMPKSKSYGSVPETFEHDNWSGGFNTAIDQCTQILKEEM